MASTTNNSSSGSMQIVQDMLMGGSAGCFAKTVCAPLERVKIVIQTAPKQTGLGMLGTGKQLVSEQGFAR